jgi:acylphosphatase
MDGLIRKRLVVRGHVQGVFFRETTRREAERRGVTGWVRNQPDGSVEAVLEGEAEAVERVIERCRSGPPGARVDAVDVEDEAPEGLGAFEVALGREYDRGRGSAQVPHADGLDGRGRRAGDDARVGRRRG